MEPLKNNLLNEIVMVNKKNFLILKTFVSNYQNQKNRQKVFTGLKKTPKHEKFCRDES